MKKSLVLSAALMLLSMSAMAQKAPKANFQLKADVQNFAKDTVLVYKGRGVKMDTLLVKNGKFTYSTNLEKPEMYYFMTPEAYRSNVRKVIRLVCVPNEKAQVSGDALNSYYATGSKYYQQFHEMDTYVDEVSKELNDYGKSISEKIQNGGDREALLKEYNEKAPAMEKAKNEKVFDFVAKHPDYEACAELVSSFDDLKDMEKLVGLLSESVKNGRMKAYYQPIIDRTKKQMEEDEKAKKLQAAGVEAPDFTLKDIQGNDFTLSSLRGKYVVLDFWGSWCIWCIKGMPKMKEYYEKYAGKFEIVGVDCNDTEEKWKAAVEKHQLPWKHVYNKRGDANDVCEKYAIQGFPTKIILSPEGKIVKTIVGEDPEFYTLLDELFSK